MSNLKIVEVLLPKGEFVETIHEKNQITIHHTAGGHRPDWTSQMWGDDDRGRVATAYVIGGKSTRDVNRDWDGVIVKCFDDSQTGYHIGAKNNEFVQAGAKMVYRKNRKGETYLANDEILCENSIAIEICNYGYLKKGRDGKFYTYVNSQISEKDVTELSQPFKGYQYYHSYTQKQIDILYELLLLIKTKHGIDLKKGMAESFYLDATNIAMVKKIQQRANFAGLKGKNGKSLVEDGIYGENTEFVVNNPNFPFEYNQFALLGEEGLYTHTNYRVGNSKSDCYPHPQLIKMLKEL